MSSYPNDLIELVRRIAYRFDRLGRKQYSLEDASTPDDVLRKAAIEDHQRLSRRMKQWITPAVVRR